MDSFYPTELRKQFTNRQYELKLFEQAKERLQKGLAFNLSIFGQRRIGKTLLMKEFILRHRKLKDFIPVYINCQTICTNPEDFAASYVGWVCYWFLTRGEETPEPFLSLPSLMRITQEHPLIRERLFDISDQLNQRSINRSLLLRLAFSFPEELGKETNTHLMLFLDEFQEVTRLMKYKNAENLLGIFREFIQTSHTGYVLAGSWVSVMVDLISDAKSPLFGQFTQHQLGTFTREDTDRLAQKILGPLSQDVLWAIYQYTFGHPYYVTHLTQRLSLLHRINELPISSDLVKSAFLIETLSNRGAINYHCDYLYTLSLEKARYYSGLKSVLSILASEEGFTQTEIARKMKVNQGMVRVYLNTLVKLDLLMEQEKRYYYRDPVLRYWVAYHEQGVELSEMPKKEDLEALLAKLDEKFQRTASELGVTKESEIRLLIPKMAGKTFEGILFGTSQTITMPNFKNIESYKSPDKQIEIDALCQNEDIWFVEIKWKNRAATIKDVQKFNEKSQKVGIKSERLWFISKSGFSENATQYAKEHGILLSNASDLEAIKAALK
ncbi:MAG: ATP-binding protein [Candidatus Poribacteria bacterium]